MFPKEYKSDETKVIVLKQVSTERKLSCSLETVGIYDFSVCREQRISKGVETFRKSYVFMSFGKLIIMQG